MTKICKVILGRVWFIKKCYLFKNKMFYTRPGVHSYVVLLFYGGVGWEGRYHPYAHPHKFHAIFGAPHGKHFCGMLKSTHNLEGTPKKCSPYTTPMERALPHAPPIKNNATHMVIFK